jgi:hypothetical protein
MIFRLLFIFTLIACHSASAASFDVSCSNFKGELKNGWIELKSPAHPLILAKNKKNIKYNYGIFSPNAEYLALSAPIHDRKYPQSSLLTLFKKNIKSHTYAPLKSMTFGKGIMAINFDKNSKTVALAAGTIYVLSLPELETIYNEFDNPESASTINSNYFEERETIPLCHQ